MAAPREEDLPKETKRTNMGGRGMAKREFCLPPPPLLPTIRSSTLRAPRRTSNRVFVSPVIPDFGGRRIVEHVTSLCRPKAAGAPRLFPVWSLPSRDTTDMVWGHSGLHFWDAEVFGEFGPLVASGLDVPALHGSEEVVDSAWFSQLQQTSVQEIPTVPVPSFFSCLPQPRNVVLDAPVLQRIVEHSSEAERWFDTLQSLVQSMFQRNARQARVQQPVVPGCRAAPLEGTGWRAGIHDRSQAELRGVGCVVAKLFWFRFAVTVETHSWRRTGLRGLLNFPCVDGGHAR